MSACPTTTPAAMPWTVNPKEEYGAPVDAVIAAATLRGFTRADFLKLAWAALDQASTSATIGALAPAFEATAGTLPEDA